MHYYQFNVADYRADTFHLDIIEHGIYRQLIDWYFLDEKPIPVETQVVIRRLRLDSNWVHKLENVLSDFFVKTENGYFHKRIEQDLEHYRTQAAKNRINGKLGGRPPKTQSVILANPTETQLKAKITLTNNQEPITNNQLKPEEANASLSESLPDSNPEPVESKPKRNGIPYQAIVDLYHKHLPTCPKVELLTTKRKGQIAARWHSGELDTLESWADFFTFCRESKFLVGATDPPPGRKRFIADLEWLTRESNYTKIVEKKYHG